jgi:hypothetical protein
MLEDAIRYARLGYRIFPCRPGTKKPYTTNGFKDATRDEGLLEGWWKQWPDALVATPDTCTVDIETKPDGPNGWETWRLLVAEHGEPVAPTVKSGNYPAGRGAHLHFSYRDDVTTGTFADGIELRAAGSYVLLPPSPHSTGVSYEGELPPIGELPPLPEWIAEMRRTRKRRRKEKGTRVSAGERHERWVEEAGRLRKQGVPVEGARRLLREFREREFVGPEEKSDDELEQILHAYEHDWDGPSLQDDIVWLSHHGLKEVEWVERPLLQVAFTLLAGRPGVGKGALVARWVARCTNGLLYGEPRPAILLSSEDDPEVDLGPRIEAAGGNRELVALPPTSFQLPRDIDWLRGYVNAIDALGRGKTGLIAVDPLGNHTGAANTDRDAEVRVALMPLAVLVNELQIPTVGVRHLSTKETKGGALAKILGSTAWIGVPRAVLAAVTDSTDPALVHVHPIKGNRVPRSESGRRFRLEGLTLPGFTESVVRALEDGVSEVDLDSELAGTKTESASGHARELLVTTLRAAGGQMESDELDAAVADGTGLKAVTVRNLRVELKDKGWLRSVPEKDDTGAVVRWYVALTNAAPEQFAPDHLARGNAISRDLDYSSQISRDLDATQITPDHHITDTREACSGSPANGSLTAEQLAAVAAYFDEHGDEHGHV